MRLQMKQIWIIVLFLLTAAMMFRTSAPAYAAISASYLDYDESGKVTEKNRTDCVEITSGTRSLADGWYVVKGDVTIEDRITIDGTDVKIIILDDCTFIVKGGIKLKKDHTLTLYGQKKGTGMLRAYANNHDSCAAIGGNGDGGTLNVHGVNVYAFGGAGGAAGIGGGVGGDGGALYSYAGSIYAQGGSGGAGFKDGGAGIGGGSSSTGPNCGYTRIYGGTIEAYGGPGAAGIGGGYFGGRGGEFFMFGGEVKAYAGVDGAGIGSGKDGGTSLYKFYMTGGNIYAQGSDGGSAIGGGKNTDGIMSYGLHESPDSFGSTFTLKGGTITARGGNHSDGAFGSGEDGEWFQDKRPNGYINFSDNMFVRIKHPSGDIDITEDNDKKVEGCFNNLEIYIYPCEHSDKECKYSGEGDKHTWTCKLCGTTGEEKHTFDENGICACGAEAEPLTVRFLNTDGSVLSEVSVPFGGSLDGLYPDTEPEKVSTTADYRYKFDKWTFKGGDIPAKITEDMDLTPKFATYVLLELYIYNGLSREFYDRIYGPEGADIDKLLADHIPKREPTETLEYVFREWQKDTIYNRLVRRTICTAYYGTVPRKHNLHYTVEWSEDYSTVTVKAICSMHDNAVEHEATISTHVSDVWENEIDQCTKYGDRVFSFEKTDFPEDSVFYKELPDDIVTSQTIPGGAAPSHDCYDYHYYPSFPGDGTVDYFGAYCKCRRCNKTLYAQTGTPTVEIIKEPTCFEYGEKRYSAYFTDDNFTKELQTYTNKFGKKGHIWEVVYQFSADHKKITAKRVCQRDHTHVDGAETVNTIATITKEPTCTEDGEVTYTAEPFANAKYNNPPSYTESVPATGHTWGNPVWEWNGTESASFTLACADCGEKRTVPAEITSTVTREPSCTEPGERTYTATVKPHTDTRTEEIEAKGHAFEPQYTWSEDFTSCTMNLVCKDCGEAEGPYEGVVTESHDDEKNSEFIIAPVPAYHYTAVFDVNGQTYTTEQTQLVEVTSPEDESIPEEIPEEEHEHSWQPEYTWSEDMKGCTMILTCADCGETDGPYEGIVTETHDENSRAASRIFVPTTINYTYTAVFDVNGQKYTAETKRTGDAPITGTTFGGGTPIILIAGLGAVAVGTGAIIVRNKQKKKEASGEKK